MTCNVIRLLIRLKCTISCHIISLTRKCHSQNNVTHSSIYQVTPPLWVIYLTQVTKFKVREEGAPKFKKVTKCTAQSYFSLFVNRPLHRYLAQSSVTDVIVLDFLSIYALWKVSSLHNVLLNVDKRTVCILWGDVSKSSANLGFRKTGIVGFLLEQWTPQPHHMEKFRECLFRQAGEIALKKERKEGIIKTCTKHNGLLFGNKVHQWMNLCQWVSTWCALRSASNRYLPPLNTDAANCAADDVHS